MTQSPSFPNSAMVSIPLDMNEVHDLSVGLISFMDSENVTVGTGVAAMVLTVGRMMAPEVLSQEDQVAFVQAFMEYVGTYFAEGGIN